MRGPVESVAGRSSVVGTLLPSNVQLLDGPELMFSCVPVTVGSGPVGMLPIGRERSISYEGPLGRPPACVQDSVSCFLAEGRQGRQVPRG